MLLLCCGTRHGTSLLKLVFGINLKMKVFSENERETMWYVLSFLAGAIVGIVFVLLSLWIAILK